MKREAVFYAMVALFTLAAVAALVVTPRPVKVLNNISPPVPYMGEHSLTFRDEQYLCAYGYTICR